MRFQALDLITVVTWVLLPPGTASPCSVLRPVSSEEMVAGADLILRATAVEYFVPPKAEGGTTGVPESQVRFRVEETVKGTYTSRQLILPGYLSERDDWNDHDPPYRFVRPNGRRGSCFANTYHRSAQFLLVLKHQDGEYSVNWYALGPVNEQLRSADDAWVQWVRARVKA